MLDIAISKIDRFVLKFWLVNVINFVIKILDIMLDFLLGYTLKYGARQEREEASRTCRTVQLVRILMRGNYSDMHLQHLYNFVLIHVEYVRPEYIKGNSKVTIMGMNEKDFFFCVTLDPNVDVTDTKNSPFMFHEQFVKAERLLIASRDTIEALADEIGDPKEKVTWLDMTGRCGSTLVCAMLSNVPNVRALSEPWILVHAQRLHVQGSLTRETYKKLLHTIIRILCKPDNERAVSHIFVKSTLHCNPQTELIHELYPDFKFMFITRHMKQAAESWRKVFNHYSPFLVHSQKYTRFIFQQFPAPLGNEKWARIGREWRFRRGNPENIVLCVLMINLAELVTFDKLKHLYNHVLMYEDILQDPEREIIKVFNVMEVDHEYIDNAKEALKNDSQKGILGKRGNEALDEKDIAEIDGLLVEYGLPYRMDMTLQEWKKHLYPDHIKYEIY